MTIMQGARARALASVSAMALLVTGSASAAEWEIQVGGYMEQYLSFSTFDVTGAPDDDGFDAGLGADIHFRPALTLDNGLKIGVDINLDGAASTTGDADGEIDEAFLFIRGSFGEILIGDHDLAGNSLTPRTPGSDFPGPDVSFVSISSGSTANYIPFSGSVGGVRTGGDVRRGTLGTTRTTFGGEDHSAGISYFTPRFAGFQLGVSYIPESSDSIAGSPTYRDIEDIFGIGFNYVRVFGDTQITLGGHWATGDNRFDPRADPQIWGAGISIEQGGFTIGGSWGESRGTSRGRNDGVAYDIGVQYELGPWTYSASHFHGQNTDNEHIGFGPKERLDTYQIGVSYDLKHKGASFRAPTYVKWADEAQVFGSVTAVQFDEDVGDPGFGTPGNDIDGFIIGTGLRLSF